VSKHMCISLSSNEISPEIKFWVLRVQTAS